MKVYNPKCALDYQTPFELLVAVILSAQCTDVRVNMVTKEMYKKVNTPELVACWRDRRDDKEYRIF